MRRAKLGVAAIAVLATAITFSVVVVSAASADEWFVGGSKLTSSAGLATSAVTDTAAALNVPALGLKIICTGSLLGNLPVINAGTTGSAERLTFMGCSVLEPAGCKLLNNATEISTEKITATARLNAAGQVVAVFAPMGNVFAAVEFEGCAFSEVAVNGKVTILAPTGNTEHAVQAIEGLGSIENNSLIAAGHPAYIEGGKALLKLQSGAAWSFHL